MNNIGINILDILPIPFSTDQCVTIHMIDHIISTPITEGIMTVLNPDKSLPPPTDFEKNAPGSEPQIWKGLPTR